MWYVYIVKCNDNSLYTGITTDVDKRIKKHNSGKGAKYTKTGLPVTLQVFFEATDRSEASKLEYKIKQLSRVEKLKIIKDGKI